MTFVEESELPHDEHQKNEKLDLGAKTTSTILVSNIPPTVNEEYLELFFESKKKVGGGPVKNIQLNRTKHWAIITFDEPGAVETVISKKPITLINAELDIHPYVPLIRDEGWIDSLEMHGLPKELTDDITSKYIERKMESAEASSAEYISDDGEEEIDGENDEETGKIVEQITDVKPVKVKMLMAIRDEVRALEKFPNAKMKMNKKKDKIFFYGDAAEIQSLKLDIYKKLSTYSVYTFQNISPDLIKLFKSSKVIEHINKKLSSNKLVCEWQTKGTALVICSTEGDIAQCCSIVRESVKEETFPICKDSAVAFLSSQWQEKQVQLSKGHEFVCNVNTMGDMIKVHIVARSDTVDEIACNVKDFVKRQTKLDAETIDFSELAPVENGQFRRWATSNLLEKIISDLTMYHISFKFVNDRRFPDRLHYEITGTLEGRELVKKRIRTMRF